MPTVYEVITDRIIKQLEAGVAPWQRPWRVRGKGGLPRNLISGREYRGINVWILLSSGGRLLYSVDEPPPSQNTSNFWVVGMDPSTGHPSGIPSRITTGDDFVDQPSVTADGKRLVFNRLLGMPIFPGRLHGSSHQERKAPYAANAGRG